MPYCHAFLVKLQGEMPEQCIFKMAYCYELYQGVIDIPYLSCPAWLVSDQDMVLLWFLPECEKYSIPWCRFLILLVESCSKLVISGTEHLVEVVDKLSTTTVVFFRSERILKCQAFIWAYTAYWACSNACWEVRKVLKSENPKGEGKLGNEKGVLFKILWSRKTLVLQLN